jgi:Tol biopolymer transport system component
MIALIALLVLSPLLRAQNSPTQGPEEPQQHLRSRVFIFDLRDGTSHLVYTADSIWEAPNWSPDGKYLILNSGGAIYKFVLRQDGTAEPQKLSIPAEYDCNNDKGVSPDGTKLAFSATVAPNEDSQVFLANADGSNIRRMTVDSPSYFHGWSPDGNTLAFVAQRNGSGQFDIYSMPASGGPEKRLTVNIHHDDGPDYSPDGKWIYINSNRSGKESIWQFPADGAGPDDKKATMVVSDRLEDWFPHISPDGRKMVYIVYPAGTPTHDPRTVNISFKLVTIHHDKVSDKQKTLVKAIGGQGSMNVNSWAPDSTRFAYVTYEKLP